MNQQFKKDTLLLRYTPEQGPSCWLRFSQPQRTVLASTPADVPAALALLDEAALSGRFAAGYLAYEAARACDPALITHETSPLPLARVGLYDRVEVLDALPPPAPDAAYTTGAWSCNTPFPPYEKNVKKIKEWIRSGDTYQVNYTLQLTSSFKGDPFAWFHQLFRAQRADYAAYAEFGDHVLCSVSPELFFRLDQERLTARPMKGTARRGLTWAEDQQQVEQLHHSAKNRAENVMILDMMRNDIGRIARTGSVTVRHLFDVERYHTVLQMISETTALTEALPGDLFRALFPSCSITGAPKVRTMQLIKDLEPEPRGIYTGAIGFVAGCHPLTGAPGRHAQFNVAIRTAHLHRPSGIIRYGVGGGIVWDSDAASEYEECQTKALVLATPTPPFSVLETMRWTPARGYVQLRDHLLRAAGSAAYFQRPWDAERIQDALRSAAKAWVPQPMRVRLLVDEQGTVTLEHMPLNDPATRCVWNVALNDRPVDEHDRFLFHKTTHRPVYDAARKRYPDADDVLLWNNRGEITETCYANVAVKRNGHWHTPPISCGLLGGTMRHALVRRGRLRESIIHVDELDKAEDMLLMNSVRGFIRVRRISRVHACAG